MPLILGIVVVVLLAAGAVLGFVYPGFFNSKTFDTAAVQAGVTKILTDSYGLKGVTGVTCDSNVKVVKGGTFACKATIDGQQQNIAVRITSDEGGYEVARPS